MISLDIHFGYVCHSSKCWAHQSVDWIADYLSHPERYPVLPKIEPGQLVDALPPTGPAQGEPMDRLLADFERLILPAITHWNHPGFMAYFANTSPGPGVPRSARSRRTKESRTLTLVL